MSVLVDSSKTQSCQAIVLKRRPFGKFPWSLIGALLLIGVLVLLLAYPMVLLFLKSFIVSRPGQPAVWTIQGWIAAFGDAKLPIALGNTFLLAALRVVVTTALAIFFAWVVSRTDTPFKGFIEMALWLGFFLPLLPVTMGWILLLDPQYGLINKWLVGLFGLADAPFNIYSYWGIVWCHLAFSTSVRFMLMTPAFSAMDAAMEEAALVCGSSRAGVLFRVTIPALAPAVLASTALGFIRSLESFEIEMVLGIPAGIYVVSTKIWDYIHWEPPLYDRATALCSIFLLFIFLLVWLHRSFLRGREFTTVTGRSHIAESLALGRWRWPLSLLSLVLLMFSVGLPVFVFTWTSFVKFYQIPSLSQLPHFSLDNYREILELPHTAQSIYNTLLVGISS